MDDVQFITLDKSLPNLLEEVGHKIDWESDEERDRYYIFRNRVFQLIDKYYQGGNNG
jgi:siderophore synthetase component|tara:strand:+ start:241 stop:411 length:171 start_codon:yes stop_codon:yes gene_type:complete